MAVLYTNNAASTLSSSITDTGTSLSVATGGGALFPAISGSNYFYATLTDSAANIEIIKVTARSSDTFTIVRGQDGTTARAWAAGDKVELRITKAMLDDFKVDVLTDPTVDGIFKVNQGGRFVIGTPSLPQYIGGRLILNTADLDSDAIVAYSAMNPIKSSVTANVITGYESLLMTDSGLTLANLIHFRVSDSYQGGTVTKEYGFYFSSDASTVTTRYGFFSPMNTGSNRWNLYMQGTASNYLGGELILNGALAFGPSTVPNYGVAGNFLKSSGSGAVPQWSALSSSDVTTALGYTPYDATNPNNYATTSALANYLPLSGGTLSGNLLINTTTDNATDKLQVAGSVSATGGFKRRAVTIADGTSITIDADSTDLASQANTQSAGTLTINAPTGTPVNGQQLLLRLTCTNAQTFSWNAIFRGSTDQALPTATSGGGKEDYLGFIYNSTDSKWDLIAKNFGF